MHPSSASYGGRERTKIRAASSAELLSTFFDQPDWARSRSSLRERPRQASYNPLFSWEGRSDDPQSFARLAVTHFPTASSLRPLCMSGSAVIDLEADGDVATLSGLPAGDKREAVPLTREQAAVGMLSDLSGDIPSREQAKQTGAKVVTTSPLQFKNMRLVTPRYEVAPLPARLARIARGEETHPVDPRLLRELNEFEARQVSAERDIKLAVKQRIRTKARVQGTPFYLGSPSLASRSRLTEPATKEWLEIRHKLRREQLAHLQSSIVTNGSVTDPNSIPESVPTLPPFQSKRLSSAKLSFAETRRRLFEREMRNEPSWNVERAMQLRSRDLNGKDYNLISHTSVPQWPTPHMKPHIDYNPDH